MNALLTLRIPDIAAMTLVIRSFSTLIGVGTVPVSANGIRKREHLCVTLQPERVSSKIHLMTTFTRMPAKYLMENVSGASRSKLVGTRDVSPPS